MEENSPLMQKEKGSFWNNYFDLLKDSEFRLTMILVFFSTLVLNFGGTLLSLFYIEVWNVDDKLAGIFLALAGAHILFFLVPGLLIEKYGIKVTYLIGFLVTIVGFSLIVFIKNLAFHVTVISLSFGLSASLLFGSLKSATNETTTPENRSLGFSIFNCMLNFSTIFLGLTSELVFSLKGINFTSYNILFLTMVGIYLMNFILTLLFSKLKKKEAAKKQEIKLSYLLNQKRYWKTFIVIFISSIPLGCIFIPGIILPIYMDRELGSTQGYGFYFASYSLMLGTFSILFDFVSKMFGLYDCVAIGGLIMSAGPLVFGVSSGYYAVGVYITITAIGGSILEPRLMDYNGFAAVKGNEGFYFGIGSFGYAFTSIFSGFISGFLLDEFCPEDKNRECWKMWYIVSAFCAGGSLSLLIFRRWIEVIRDHQETDPFVLSSHLG